MKNNKIAFEQLVKELRQQGFIIDENFNDYGMNYKEYITIKENIEDINKFIQGLLLLANSGNNEKEIDED